MNVHEWALIAFTILAQLSVGSFLILGFIHFFTVRKAGTVEADRLSDRALLVIGPALIIGMIASLFHLGKFWIAYRAVTNLGSSWLSMEILSGVLFAVVGGLFALMQWRKIGTFAVRNIIAWVAALLGVWLVFSMSKVYMLATIPTWNTLATPVTFFTSTFLLGGLAMAAVFVANYVYLQRTNPESDPVQNELLRDSLRWIAILSICLLGLEFLMIPLNMAYQAAGPAVATAAVSTLMSEYTVIMVLRLVLVFVGAGILGVFLYRTALSPGREGMLGNLAYAAFILVLVAEVLGRFLFYASYARIGI